MSTHNLHTHPSDDTSYLHRIGSVSRLAGVPVSTLRMWEGRYGAFTPGKTGGKHRLYAEGDVVRARLLRQLTEAGHSIGGIARLGAPQLQQLLANSRSADARARAREEPRRLGLVVVGAALATRIAAPHWRERLPADVLEVRGAYATIDEALQATREAAAPAADLLVVKLNALQPDTTATLLRLVSALNAQRGIVLYNFAAEATVADLRDAGFLLRREPIGDDDLAELIRSFTWADAGAGASSRPVSSAIPQRRFSDADLARVAASPTAMLCECPRHLVDIITQLSSFEEYSAQCLNRTEEDAQVHGHLRSVAGSARALFEGALELVLAHEESKARGRA